MISRKAISTTFLILCAVTTTSATEWDYHHNHEYNYNFKYPTFFNSIEVKSRIEVEDTIDIHPIMNLWSFKNRIHTMSIGRFESDPIGLTGWGMIMLFHNPENYSLEECAWKIVERITEASENYVFQYDTLQVAGKRALAVSSWIIVGDKEHDPEYIRFGCPYVFQNNGIVFSLSFPVRSVRFGEISSFEVTDEMVDEMLNSFHVE